nr:hypothetical protein [Clavibacter michiganensis]
MPEISVAPIRERRTPLWIRSKDALLGSDAVIAIVVAVTAGLLAFGRLPADARNVLWAEDGRTFLEDRLRLGSWTSIFKVYEGYVHVVPRLLTDLAVWVVPLDNFAVASSLLASATFGILAGLVYFCSRDLVSNRVFRVLLAMITVLAPVLPIEVLGNFANVHWGFLWLAPWLLLYRPRGWFDASVLGLVGLLGGLTEIQMLLFLPFAIVNLKKRKAWVIVLPTTIGVVVQLLAALTSPRTPNNEIKPGVLDIVVGYVELPILGAFEGHSTRIQTTIMEGTSVAILNTILALIILVFSLSPILAGKSVRLLLPFLLIVASILAWAAAIWLNPGPAWQYANLDSSELESFRITRYVAVPSMMVLAAISLAAGHAFDRGGHLRFIAGVAVGIVVMGFIGSYHLETIRRDGGPEWSDSIVRLRDNCERGVAAMPIEIAPPAWNVDVSCDDVKPRR